jgi:WhiB family redox-sensing transcriptional regulator
MNADRPEWQQQAACRGVGPEIFYSTHPHDAAQAREYCGRCPVTESCLQYAIDGAERYGVWAALGVKDRRKVSTRTRGQRTDAAVCGTESGYNAHLRRNETPCRHCRWVANEAARIRKADREWRAANGDEVAA